MQAINEHNFEALFRQYYIHLCNYAGKFIADSQIVEDIVQNFFIAVWEKKHLKLSVDTFLPYAYKSIKNGCINYYKSLIVKEEFFDKLEKDWKDQLAESEEEFPYKKEIRHALDKLPPKCKHVFLLKCVSDLKYKEIAEVTGISVNTVKYHLGEAFRIMREELRHLPFVLFLFFS